MAKTTIATSAELLDLLRKSALLGNQAYSQAEALVATEADPVVAAQKLVAEKILTPWQSEQLLAGQFVMRLGDSKFLLVDETGDWEFGRSFLAENGTTGERITLKLVSSRLASNKSVQKELVADLAKVAKLKNDGLINFREVGRSGPRFFLVSDLVPAESMATRLAASRRLGNAAAVRLLEQSATALAHLHQRGLAHGCLTPSKLTFTAGGRVAIADSGLHSLVPTLLNDPKIKKELATYLPSDAWPHRDSPPRCDLHTIARMVERARGLAPSETQEPSRASSATTDAVDAADGADWWSESVDSTDADAQLARILSGLLGSPAAGDAEQQPEPVDLPDAPSLVTACRAWRKQFLSEDNPSESETLELVRESDELAVEHDSSIDLAIEEEVEKADSPLRASADSSAIVIDTSRRRKKSDHGTSATTEAKAANKKGGKGKRGKNAKSDEAKSKKSKPGARARHRARLLIMTGMSVIAVAVLLTAAYAFKDRWKEPGKEIARNQDAARPVAPRTPANDDEGQLPDAGAPLPEPPPDPVTKTLDANPISPLAGAPSPVRSAEVPGPGAGVTSPSDAAPAATGPTATGPAAPVPPNANQPPASATGPPAPAPDSVAAKTPDLPPTPAPPTIPPTGSASASPTTSPPSPVPSPAPASSYLAQFPASVALPKIEAAVGGPVTLATVAVDDMLPCYLELLGGDRVIKGPQTLALDNAQGGTAPRQWDVFVVAAPGSRKAVAQFTLLGGQFTFQWLADASTENLAGMLDNCFLKISAGTESKTVGLRQTIRVPALIVDLDKGLTTRKWDIPNGPDPSSCRVEIVGLEGPFPPHSLQPEGTMAADGGKQWVLFGESPSERVLVFHIEFILRRQLVVNVSSLMPHGEEPNDAWVRDRSRKSLKANRTQLGTAFGNAVAQAKLNADSFAAINEAALSRTDREQFLQRRNLARVDLERAEASKRKMDQLEQLCQALNDKGKVQFRLIFEADGRSIELMRSE